MKFNQVARYYRKVPKFIRDCMIKKIVFLTIFYRENSQGTFLWSLQSSPVTLAMIISQFCYKGYIDGR